MKIVQFSSITNVLLQNHWSHLKSPETFYFVLFGISIERFSSRIAAICPIWLP